MTNTDIRAEQALPENLILHNAAKVVSSIKFEDEAGQARSLTDVKGKIVVLNIWATWCVPCRKEMPALDRLQVALGGPDFEVVPVSIDRGGIDVVRKFYADIGVRSLAMYVDKSGQILREVGAVGLPTTLLIDGAGNEIGRVVGPAEWDAPEIAEFLKPFIANKVVPANRAHQSGSQPQQLSDARGAIARGLQWLRALLNK
jgi:thiol-disulfide isomerase/thioredoxin